LIGLGYGHLRFRLQELRLGLRELSGGLRELSLGLVDGCLKGPRVDLKERLPLPDGGALGVVLLKQIARHLRLDIRIYHPVQRADPFAVDGNVLLLYLHDFDVGRRRSFGGRRRLRAAG